MAKPAPSLARHIAVVGMTELLDRQTFTAEAIVIHAGPTQLDLLLEGATLYASAAQDDHRPVWPFDTTDLVQQVHVHEQTDLHPSQHTPAHHHRAPDRRSPRLGGGLSPLQEAVMRINLSEPRYRLKISRASRMSELAALVTFAQSQASPEGTWHSSWLRKTLRIKQFLRTNEPAMR